MHVFKQTFAALVAVALMLAFGAAAQTNPPERLNDQQLEQLLAPIAPSARTPVLWILFSYAE